MILLALTNYYRRNEQLPRPGWVRRGVDYNFVLDSNGNCINVEPIGEQKKGKMVPRPMLLPAIGKQALKHANSGNDANLLWDNASFVLGTGSKGARKITSFLSTLRDWFGAINDEGVTAVDKFCSRVQSHQSEIESLLEQFRVKEDFGKRDPVLMFRLVSDVEGVHARKSVRDAYERRSIDKIRQSGLRGTCLVTGEEDVPLVSNETVIKGVWRAQPAGANIISFNARAFESYGKRERNGENAPVGLDASFAYTTALNHLLATEHQRVQVGDASTVFWAEEPHDLETMVPDLFGEPPKDEPDRGADAMRALYKSVNTGKFAVGKSDARFHVLGLAPNAARIAIRFWETASAMELARRLRRHFDDIAVVRAPHDPEHLSLFRLLTACAAQNKADNIPPNLGGEIMRAILEGLPYPATWLSAAVQRCRAEQKVTYPRAAGLKACLNRSIRLTNRSRTKPESEFQTMLDKTNPNPAYRLGRLFAALERIQEDASGGAGKLNATIRDRYYGAASSTPVAVFTTLLRLKNHHLGKLGPGRVVQMEKLLGEIMSELDDFPKHLSLPDQGRFALGYYHQRQAFFNKSEPLAANPEEME